MREAYFEGILNERDNRTRGVCIFGRSELFTPISFAFHDDDDELFIFVAVLLFNLDGLISVEINFLKSDLSEKKSDFEYEFEGINLILCKFNDDG